MALNGNRFHACRVNSPIFDEKMNAYTKNSSKKFIKIVLYEIYHFGENIVNGYCKVINNCIDVGAKHILWEKREHL
jgi:hypothetical protein